ncbi:MAG TPA: hypothetical protein VFA94_08400 [Acidimicrobiales bacterium]|nr:hypothetical protein [Acidimicrobiales bacterium]
MSKADNLHSDALFDRLVERVGRHLAGHGTRQSFWARVAAHSGRAARARTSTERHSSGFAR